MVKRAESVSSGLNTMKEFLEHHWNESVQHQGSSQVVGWVSGTSHDFPVVN